MTAKCHQAEIAGGAGSHTSLPSTIFNSLEQETHHISFKSSPDLFTGGSAEHHN